MPEKHVAVVANSFVVRDVDFANTETFVVSKNMKTVALRSRRWDGHAPFDFTRVFSGPEMGHRYSSGRRMWQAFRLLAPGVSLPPTYTDYVRDAPYPPTVPATGVALRDMFAIMRNYYQGTPYSLAEGLAAGPFGSPARWAPGKGELEVKGSWERPIAIVRTIVSYVVQCRSWLPPPVAATIWLAPHAAHTSVYLPFPAAWSGSLPASHTNNSLGEVTRGVGAWQASRYVFNIAQLKFNHMIRDIRAAQALHENRSLALQQNATDQFLRDGDVKALSAAHAANARTVVAAWWELSDVLLLRYADGYCNGCEVTPRHIGYPAWWLLAVNYTAGPPPTAAS